MDELLDFGELIAQHVTGSRGAMYAQLPWADSWRQPAYGRMAGYEDVNDATWPGGMAGPGPTPHRSKARPVNGCLAGVYCLSMVKNASAGMSLRCNASMTVMRAAGLRDLDNPSNIQNLPGMQALLAESQVGPRSIVVSRPVLSRHNCREAEFSTLLDRDFPFLLRQGDAGQDAKTGTRDKIVSRDRW